MLRKSNGLLTYFASDIAYHDNKIARGFDLMVDIWDTNFLIYVVSMIGEVNRLPFDLPEAEGELVAGHMVEYSSMKFAWYYLSEYINMFNVSAMCVTPQ